MSAEQTLEPGVPLAPGGTSVGRVRWATVDGRAVVLKRATGEDRPHLRREAAVLRAAAGPQVVPFLDLRELDDATELVTGAVPGRTLGGLLHDPDIPPSQVIAALAATCDAVSRLHARGWSHGRLAPDHVLVTTRGRIRFCSLAAARRTELTDADASRDRAALLRIVDGWTNEARAGTPWTGRLRRRVATGRLRRRTARLVDDPDPLVLSRVLRQIDSARAVRSALVLGLTLVVTAVGFSCVALDRDVPPVRHLPAPQAASTTTAPSPAAASTASTSAAAGPAKPADTCRPVTPSSPDTGGDGCGEEVTVSGNDVTVDGVRYRIGLAGDTVLVVDTDCDGRATVVDLRIDTGQLFEFRSWARPDAPATARSVGTFPGARAIEPLAARCGPVRVVLADGTRVDSGGTP